MIAETVEQPPMSEAAHRAKFFRQSGWLMIATVGGGVFMWAVHFLNWWLPAGSYGEFGFYLAVMMCVPTIPLQMVFAQQTARTLAINREREVSGMIRMIWLGLSLLWLIVALIVLVLHNTIMVNWKVSTPAGLWLMVLAILFSLWVPMFQGVLQGQQNFLWFGWSQFLNGVARLGVAALAVVALHGGPAGMTVGVLSGTALCAAIAVWQSRALWTAPALPFDSRSLLRQVIPLMIGFGAYQVLFMADAIMARLYFSPTQMDIYTSAGTLSRALQWAVGPMAAVMFPRIVHSAARSEKSDLMKVVLTGTAILAIGGAAALSVLGPWIVKIVYKNPAYVTGVCPILPWYAAALVPMALANVLLNNLLARSAFKLVPALCVLAVLYPLGITCFHAEPKNVLQTMGVSNLLFLAICAWYTWRLKAEEKSQPAQEISAETV
jgi:O-antigen/teichoic acid export membrane protein